MAVNQYISWAEFTNELCSYQVSGVLCLWRVAGINAVSRCAFGAWAGGLSLAQVLWRSWPKSTWYLRQKKSSATLSVSIVFKKSPLKKGETFCEIKIKIHMQVHESIDSSLKTVTKPMWQYSLNTCGEQLPILARKQLSLKGIIH